MSRYRIAGVDANHDVAVGWDNPLQTFFAHVEDRTKDEEESVVLMCGAKPGDDILTVEALQNRIREYAEIPANIKTKLQCDFENRTEPSPLQKMAKKMFGGEPNSKLHG